MTLQLEPPPSLPQPHSQQPSLLPKSLRRARPQRKFKSQLRLMPRRQRVRPCSRQRARLKPMLRRQRLPSAAWSCPRPGQDRYIRRLLFRPLPSRPAPVTRLLEQGFNAANQSLTATALQAVPAAAPPAVPAAIRSARLAALPQLPASSPADRAPSIPRAQLRAAMQAPVDPELPAHALASALAQDLADHHVPALALVPEQAALHLPVRPHARSALPTNAPAGALRSTPRPKKAP
jgi:hypothetical protein